MTWPVSIPNRPAGSDTRSIAAILANFDAILDVFNNREIEPQSSLKVGSPGQVLVGDNSGIWTPRTISGDVTLSSAGGAEIGPSKVTSGMLASGAALANLAAASVPDAKLSSPNNSVYRTLTSVGTSLVGGNGTGTYFFTIYQISPVGGTTNSTVAPTGLIYFDDADYAVGSLTQKLRVRQQVIVGSTSPSTVTLNCGLYPVTISGGNYTLGPVVPGSATSTTGLATNTISPFISASGDFTIPSDGAYCLGLVIGSIACPAGIAVSAQLQTRNV